jgi:hypothetical protein
MLCGLTVIALERECQKKILQVVRMVYPKKTAAFSTIKERMEGERRNYTAQSASFQLWPMFSNVARAKKDTRLYDVQQNHLRQKQPGSASFLLLLYI